MSRQSKISGRILERMRLPDRRDPATDVLVISWQSEVLGRTWIITVDTWHGCLEAITLICGEDSRIYMTWREALRAHPELAYHLARAEATYCEVRQHSGYSWRTGPDGRDVPITIS